jgi:phosphate transport system permease protein
MRDQFSFTGRRRERKTGRSVKVADGVSRTLITVGGIGTIVAVATVCLFLTAVVVPLFLPAKAELVTEYSNPAPASGAAWIEVDEYLTMGYACAPDGTVTSVRLDTGEVLETIDLFPDRTPTAWSFSFSDDSVLAGFADGSIQPLRISYETEFLDESLVPEEYFALEPGESAPYEGGVVEMTTEGQFRLQRLSITMLGDPEQIGAGPIRALHHVAGSSGWTAVAATATEEADHALLLVKGRETTNMMTGEKRVRFSARHSLPYALHKGEDPAFVRVNDLTTLAYAAWTDGHTLRIRTTPPAEAYIAEEIDLVEEPGATLTALEFLLGGETLLSGDSTGRLLGWFNVPLEHGVRGERPTQDRFNLLPAKRFASIPGGDSPVRSIRSSTRTRMFAAGYESGAIGVFYVTTESRMLHEKLPLSEPVLAVTIAPKEDAIIALSPTHAYQWEFEKRYPEASLVSLFGLVWYEGYNERDFMWQSSGGTDDSEPKLSLVPLIFGTIKGTIYSMLFGAPLALLAALYTSEFLNPKVKSIIKPLIEMMASLPSVVLGFLAALVFAPVVEKFLPATLACFFTIPFAILLGAFIWQMIPRSMTIRLQSHRVWFIIPLLPVGLYVGALLGPVIESLMFGGNLRGWLNGLHVEPNVGHARGGWILLLLPLGAMAVGIFMSLWVNPRLRRRTESLDRRNLAWIDLTKFLIGTALTIGLVTGIAMLLSLGGFDLRKPLPHLGSVVDTFDQRNALVVGFVMGFAIIPIIYTIADDALSTVPEHLRGASLGAGATPWQTAVRIVIPTAMSGLFSALMIGMGRAVGETMIVLMAAGNTPVMNMNMFEGFRTLSATIAVELQEAPVGETHYRTLFVAALVLFAMTFVVNTVAEGVRLRFRKRAYQL